MTICKFFLQNRCTFGDRCKFEHAYPNEMNYSQRRQNFQGDSGRRGNYMGNVQDEYNQGNYRGRPDDRYHLNRNQRAPQENVNYQNSRNQPSFSFEQYFVLIKDEINQLEAGNMWTLTSFGPLRQFGSMPQWYDYSPEEVRWAAYVAKQQNTHEQYKSTMELLSLQAKLQRDNLKSVTAEAIQMVKQYLTQRPDTIYPLEMDVFRSASFAVIPDNSFTSIRSFPTAVEAEMEESPSVATVPSVNIFGSVPPPPQTNIFGSVPPPPQGNLFGSVPLPPQTNIFGSVPPPPSHNIFGSVSTQQKSIFGSAPSSQTSVFSSSLRSESTEASSKFEFMDEDLDYDILAAMWRGDNYSNPSDLTDQEMAQFKAQKFEYGKVPIVPPPRQFC